METRLKKWRLKKSQKRLLTIRIKINEAGEPVAGPWRQGKHKPVFGSRCIFKKSMF